MPLREQRKQEQFERIIKKKQIGNDYDMDNVINKLVQDSSSTENQMYPLVVNYYLKANQRNIRILSLDGGGKISQITVNGIDFFRF
jgi:hypothetical protein